MKHTWGGTEVHSKFQLEILKGRDSLADLDVDEMILKWTFKKGMDWIM
jgi:hypothetical protein